MSGMTCPAPDCDLAVDLGQFACTRDWFRLPAALRGAIGRAWRARQTALLEGDPPDRQARLRAAHQAAMAAGIDWYARHPR